MFLVIRTTGNDRKGEMEMEMEIQEVFPKCFQTGSRWANSTHDLDVGMIRESVSFNAPRNQRKPVPLTH
jgi:hypothetical protein